MKACSKCGEVKRLSDFSPAKQCADGYRPECKPCHNAIEKARPKAHRRSSTAEYKRDERMRRLFGITLDDFEAMLAAQGGVCAICHEACDWKRRDKQPLVVDHDHATGRVRGLLCHACNGLLGWARDNTHVLSSAIDYLERVEVKQDEAA